MIDKNIFGSFDMQYGSIHIHFLKHLNRYGKWNTDIPEWSNEKKEWIPKYKLYVREAKPGLDNRKLEKLMGKKEGELGDTLYTFMWEVRDLSTNSVVNQGISETRNSMFEFYGKCLESALTLRNKMYGVDTLIKGE